MKILKSFISLILFMSINNVSAETNGEKYKLAVELLGKDTPQAMRMLRELVDKQYMKAYYKLGSIYWSNSLGIDRDLKQATKYLVIAASNGNGAAIDKLYCVDNMWNRKGIYSTLDHDTVSYLYNTNKRVKDSAKGRGYLEKWAEKRDDVLWAQACIIDREEVEPSSVPKRLERMMNSPAFNRVKHWRYVETVVDVIGRKNLISSYDDKKFLKQVLYRACQVAIYQNACDLSNKLALEGY